MSKSFFDYFDGFGGFSGSDDDDDDRDRKLKFGDDDDDDGNDGGKPRPGDDDDDDGDGGKPRPGDDDDDDGNDGGKPRPGDDDDDDGNDGGKPRPGDDDDDDGDGGGKPRPGDDDDDDGDGGKPRPGDDDDDGDDGDGDVFNKPPKAKDDSAMTDEGEAVHIDVLNNDFDPNGDPLKISGLGQAQNGTVEVKNDGTVAYTPDDGFVGKDSFVYRITDHRGGYDTAKVHVQVKDVNEAPIAKDDSAMTDEGQAVKINVLGNDSDPDGDTINVSSLEDASNGSVSLNNDGTVTYTPDDGFVGKDSFEYHISDGNGGTDTASVHIDVKDVNEAPIAKDDSAMTDEGQAVKINVLGNDSDPDGDAINVSSLEDASNGSVSLNNDGTVTYTPDAGFVGKDSFEYHISDGNGGTDTASVHIDVKEVPDEKNLIEGNDRNNHLNGTNGDDTIKGFGGWDTLNGNGGNDHLIGGAGLDNLNGGAGNDVINGTDAVNAGAGERDHAIGGSGMDTFILGDANQAYYTAEGNRDFLRISDFEVGVDKVQLSGSRSDYHVDGNKLCIGDETIAIFDNLDSINLNSGDFEFV